MELEVVPGKIHRFIYRRSDVERYIIRFAIFVDFETLQWQDLVQHHQTSYSYYEMTLIIIKHALQARKMSNDTKIPYYTYRRSAFDALFVLFCNS